MNWQKELEKIFGKKWKIKTACISVFLVVLLLFSIASIINNMIIIGLTGLIFGILLLILVITLAVKRKGKHKTDYKMFFILGICFIPIGVATGNFAFTGLGVVYMAIGLAHKKKWKK